MISFLLSVWLGGAIVTALRYVEDWDVIRRSHVIEAVLVSVLWFIFVPLNVIDIIRNK